jgi:hypothetical protein
MRRFLKKVFRNVCPATTAQSERRAPRTSLQLEGMEDRTVLSSATLSGATLSVNASPGVFKAAGPGLPIVAHFRTITLQEDATNHAKIDVLDSGKLLGKFKIHAIKTVDVNVAGLDSVRVVDTKGLPFASGTTVSLAGHGSFNSLTLAGSRVISGGETYTAGNGSQPGSLTLGGTTFDFSSTIGSVTDVVKTTAPLVVKAFGQNVTLSGSDGVTQTLSGLSIGGAGDSLSYSNKDLVNLEMESANANVSLNATAGATGEQFFVTDLVGNDEGLTLNATPSSVTTSVVVAGEGCGVFVGGNSSPVFINGTSTTNAIMGTNHGNGGVTSGILANVSVENVGTLVIADSGNHTTQENVRVTESTISGTGLFGNSTAEVKYSTVGKLDIFAGQEREQYTVTGSTPTVAFNNFSNPIEIDGSANGGLFVDASVNSNTNLDLVVRNASKADNSATLVLFAPGATLNPIKNPISETGAPILSGAEAAFFANGGHSAVFYQDFSEVLGINHVPVG